MGSILHAANRGTGLSERIWLTGLMSNILEDNGKGVMLEDDFLGIRAFASATPAGGYTSYIDSGASIANDTDDLNGVINIVTGTTDNDEASLTNGVGFCSLATTSAKAVAFEARLKVTALVEAGVFVGLAEPGTAAANALVDSTGAIKDADLVGFHVAMAASGPTMDAIYRKSGESVVTVVDDVHTSLTSSLTDDTYMTLGFKYEPTVGDGKLSYFVDGELVGTVTDVTGSTFPGGEKLALLFAIKTGNTTSKTMAIDWFRLVTER